MRKKQKSGGHGTPGQDPQAQREARRYERPIASREFILQVITEADHPVDQEGLADLLGLHDEEAREALRRRLNAMVRDGQLVRNRRDCYALADQFNLIPGRVITHPDSFGFLVPDAGGEDVYLSARTMNAVFHNDRVMVRITGKDRRGRLEGDVVEVLQRNTHRVVGRFHRESGVSFVVPDNKRITHDISVPEQQAGGAAHGQIVTVEIIEQPAKHARPVGRVVEVLGEHMAPGMEIDIAIRSYDIPEAWPEAVAAEIQVYGTGVAEADKEGRTDLRGLPLVTIDGEDARDFDDAVYCERTPTGWRLIVAIADVSHYVQPGTALDREAETRGNSVYFPERVIPMLPEVLSNGLCSLNPEVDRLCMACEMHIGAGGKITRSRFIEGVMRSQARLTYTEAAAIVVENDKQARSRYHPLVPHLEELYRLYQVLRAEREAPSTSSPPRPASCSAPGARSSGSCRWCAMTPTS
jgi:ribonuclease R